MLGADAATRELSLAGALRQHLATSWPCTMFVVDLAAALERPGAEIAVSWTDGPPPAAVIAELRPRWTVVDDPAGYPIVVNREPSSSSLAAAIVTLNARGQLAEALARGPAAFEHALHALLDPLQLPSALSEDVRTRAALLGELAHSPAQAEPWFRWLVGGGAELLRGPLDDALRDPDRGSLTS